ncbi:MAG: hypothetical protein MRY49_02010 [Candidatus Pacebacteria bacterium]|nr:hypothetical protein [Candidatus Paceibacterota bacterium]
MDLSDLKEFFIILHVLGAVIGAGAAFISDAMFFSSVKDRVVSRTEIRFMKIGSTFVWIGLVILFISGSLIFLTDPEGYLSSSKFLIKMFIVFVIFLNGIVFHAKHLPLIGRHADHHYPSSDEFVRKKKLLTISGVISVTSWMLALILGSLSSIPFSFITALVVYLLIEIVSIFVVLSFSNRMF